MAYVKLFGSILASTIWREPPPTRVLWITMLAMADRDGLVEASVPGLADLARLGVDECRRALAALAAPDPDSRTKENEGRRIAEVRGGWHVLNYEHYRDKQSAEDLRESARKRQQRKRERDKSRSSQEVTSVTPSGSGSGTSAACAAGGLSDSGGDSSIQRSRRGSSAASQKAVEQPADPDGQRRVQGLVDGLVQQKQVRHG